MIIKSYENNKIKNIISNYILLYGLNEGYKEQIIKEIFIENFEGEISRYDENDLISNETDFVSDLLNKSLFNEKKIIIISRVTEKIFNIISEILEKNIKDIKIILNCGALDKKSKLRNLFEKNKQLICIPFYEDDSKNLSIFANNFLKKKKIKLSQEIINIIVEKSKGDRKNIYTELLKLESLSLSKKNISIEDVEKLCNLAENYSAFELSENYLSKNKKKISNILNENHYTNDDCILILRTILNQSKRLLKLKNEFDKHDNIELAISSYKPPIFWKEKENIKKQIKSWSTNEVKNMIYKINDLEILIKKNSNNSLNFVSDFVSNY